MPTAAPWNVPCRAQTPTYDGSGQAIHPSVLDFRQINGATWRGWRYWMAMTPFTKTDDQAENPQILVSQDGFHWYDPPGIRKPLFLPPVGGFLSDTHLQYDPDADELVMLYRVFDGVTHLPHIARSSTGSDWPATSVGITFARAEQILSPCLVRVGPGDWHLYGLTRDTRVFQRWTSTDLFAWEGPTHLTGLHDVPTPWHLDVQAIDGVFHMLIDRGPRYLTHDDDYRAATSLDGLHWAVAADDFMHRDDAHRWEYAQLYRACFQPHEDGAHFQMWYSAEGRGEKWWTGFTQVSRDTWPSPPPPGETDAGLYEAT